MGIYFMNYEEFRKKISDSPFPALTVDVIIVIDGKIVLIKRKYPPFGWALPGGFVEKGETVEAAARREVLEETGLQLESLAQFRVYSEPSRDQRFHSITVVFSALGKGDAHAASDASGLQICDILYLPDDIAFDHRRIIKEYFSRKSES
jgi:ADP-ribose pyrophosphatase YjhB (NUDIX family)